MTFKLAEVKGATGYFDKEKIVGKGGFGEVFRGVLRHTAVAVKVLVMK